MKLIYSTLVTAGVRAEMPRYQDIDDDVRLKKRLEQSLEENISENYFKPIDKNNLLNRYKNKSSKLIEKCEIIRIFRF